MMEKVVHKTSWYAFVLQETYHTLYPLLLGMTFACVHFYLIIKRVPINILSRFRQFP